MTEFDEIPHLKLSMFARERVASAVRRGWLQLLGCIVEIKIRAHDYAPSVFRRPLKLGGIKPSCSATAV